MEAELPPVAHATWHNSHHTAARAPILIERMGGQLMGRWISTAGLWLCPMLALLVLAASNAAANVAQLRPSASAGQATIRPVSMQTDIAAGELTRIEQEIVNLTRQRDEIVSAEQASRSFEPIRPMVQQLRAAAGSYCSATPEVRADFDRQVNGVVERLRRISGSMPQVFPWEFADVGTASACPAGPAAFLEDIEGALVTTAPGNTDRIDDQLRQLRERRVEVIREMSEGVAGARIAKNIPWLMLIIFGLGAAILAGLKLFRTDIQQELVGSGQIVQFVTILILLGVILALGLAERLEGETLGTLLGGLAGYVLSQGVGRQTQQRVLSAIRSAAVGNDGSGSTSGGGGGSGPT